MTINQLAPLKILRDSHVVLDNMNRYYFGPPQVRTCGLQSKSLFLVIGSTSVGVRKV